MAHAATTHERALSLACARTDAPTAWQRPSVRLTVLFAALTCLGLVMVASVVGTRDFLGATVRRLAFTAAGVAAFVAGARVSYQWWRRHSLLALGTSLAGLAAVLLWGARINGARRWLYLGPPVGFQPSEFAKIGLCIWLAAYCERHASRMRGFAQGFLAPLSVVGLVCVLVLAEPDFGTAVLIGVVCMVVLLVFGTRLVFALLAGAAALPLMQHLIVSRPYRLRRILAFLDPWADPQGLGYQMIQSKIAIGSGGAFGLGPGAGIQKTGFLPGTDNDFIFSIIGEELGFVGCAIVIVLLLAVLWEVLKVILRSRDAFGFGLALGLSIMLGTQAAVHIAVVTGSVPPKGLSLPFISAGGSSLVASMFAAGILVNIARSEERPDLLRIIPWEQDVPAYQRLAWRLWETAIAAGREMWRRPAGR